MPKIFISAGDPSGDVHSARLMQAILDKRKDVEFVGIGGRNMQKLGLKSLAKIEDISVVGFWEVAKRLKYFTRLMDECKDIIKSERIDLFVPVDYPGFNIKLSAFAKSLSIPVIYFIAPQLWAWGKNRAEKLKGAVDKLLVVFPFEEDFFNQYSLDTTFIGHPLLDNPLFQENQCDFSERENILALLPGSRKQEVERHLELYINSATKFRESHKDYRIILAKAGDVDISKYNNLISNSGIEIENDSLALMKKAKLGIVKTGTSNLEAALARMPFAMVYKTSFFSYIISKRLINLDYVSIVNILQNKAVIEELIQKDANIGRIVSSLTNIAQEPTRSDEILTAFQSIRKNLGGSGAAENAAQIITNLL